jgi:hypothetical protein
MTKALFKTVGSHRVCFSSTIGGAREADPCAQADDGQGPGGHRGCSRNI